MSNKIQFKRGLKANLPTSAEAGMPLWCTDTQELYIGTGNEVVNIGGISQEIDTINTINPIGSNSSDSSRLKRNTAISMQGSTITAQTFNGNLNGNAASSTNASNDGNGNNIVDTYANKIDLDLKLNIADVKSYIKEVYVNGKSGYILYSDGLCEQWGVADIGSNKSNTCSYACVSLLKSYNDQNYTIQANHKEAASNNSYKLCNGSVNITNQQFSYFYIRANTTTTNDTYRYFYWRTLGYVMNNNEGIGGGGGLGDLEDIFG